LPLSPPGAAPARRAAGNLSREVLRTKKNLTEKLT
jgi:hypothetical protein